MCARNARRHTLFVSASCRGAGNSEAERRDVAMKATVAAMHDSEPGASMPVVTMHDSDSEASMPELEQLTSPAEQPGILQAPVPDIVPLVSKVKQDLGKRPLSLPAVPDAVAHSLKRLRVVQDHSALQPSESKVLPLLAIEICAGAAGCSKQLVLKGYRALAVDYNRNKSTPLVPIVQADLTTAEGQAIVLSALESGEISEVGISPNDSTAGGIAVVSMAPPCGTASRARERPITPSQRAAGMPEPKPLRDATYPEGFPKLSGADAVRVAAANEIYRFCCKVALRCLQLNIPFWVENPWRSWFWAMPCVKEVMALTQEIVYDTCMHGGCRPKRQRIIYSQLDLKHMALLCDGSHMHKEWSFDSQGFDTAKEAEYPELFCRCMAKAVECARPCAQATAQKSQVRALAAAANEKQSSGHKMPNVVS